MKLRHYKHALFALAAPILFTPTAYADGKSDFTAYCAGCHGIKADGNGSKALSTKRAPASLTHLQQNNGGYFPYRRVREVIDGRIAKGKVRSHYNSDMPVWGKVFTDMAGGVSETLHSEAVVKMRVLDLTDYIASIQIIDRIKIEKVPDSDSDSQ